MRTVFCDNFACLHTRQNRHLLIAGPLSEAKKHWVVNWLQLLNQLNIVWRHTKGFMQNSSLWWLRKVQLLRSMVKWCWWRFTHTFSHSSNIIGCTHLVYRWGWWSRIYAADSAKIRTQFSHTFCNITIIFRVISQYFPALFKRIHKGRIKLIIYKIRHELSVTTHEISTCWKKKKKTLDDEPNIYNIPINHI